MTFGLTVLVVHELVGPYSLGARYFLDLPLGLALTALLVAGSRPGRTAAVLGFRPLAFIGAFSYSIYLIHVPLLAVTWQYALDPLGLHGARALAPMLVVGLPLIVGLSYLFFVCCERPFMSGSQRRAARGDFAQPDVDRREEHHRPSLDPPVSVGNVPA